MTKTDLFLNSVLPLCDNLPVMFEAMMISEVENDDAMELFIAFLS